METPANFPLKSIKEEGVLKAREVQKKERCDAVPWEERMEEAFERNRKKYQDVVSDCH